MNNKDEDDKIRLLKPTSGDYIHTGIKAAVSALPMVGGPIAEVFSRIFVPPLEKRRDALLIDLYTELKHIEETNAEFKIEDLANNDNFISVLMHAIQIVLRTHQEEKIEALKNVVINSISTSRVEESLQLIFLNLIDQYTPWHLKILKFLKDPVEYGRINGIKYPDWVMAGLGTAIEICYPDLKDKQDFYNLVIEDMISDGLLQKGGYVRASMTKSGVLASRTTEMGNLFLQYISEQ